MGIMVKALAISIPYSFWEFLLLHQVVGLCMHGHKGIQVRGLMMATLYIYCRLIDLIHYNNLYTHTTKQ